MVVHREFQRLRLNDVLAAGKPLLRALRDDLRSGTAEKKKADSFLSAF